MIKVYFVCLMVIAIFIPIHVYAFTPSWKLIVSSPKYDFFIDENNASDKKENSSKVINAWFKSIYNSNEEKNIDIKMLEKMNVVNANDLAYEIDLQSFFIENNVKYCVILYSGFYDNNGNLLKDVDYSNTKNFDINSYKELIVPGSILDKEFTLAEVLTTLKDYNKAYEALNKKAQFEDRAFKKNSRQGD